MMLTWICQFVLTSCCPNDHDCKLTVNLSFYFKIIEIWKIMSSFLGFSLIQIRRLKHVTTAQNKQEMGKGNLEHNFCCLFCFLVLWEFHICILTIFNPTLPNSPPYKPQTILFLCFNKLKTPICAAHILLDMGNPLEKALRCGKSIVESRHTRSHTLKENWVSFP